MFPSPLGYFESLIVFSYYKLLWLCNEWRKITLASSWNAFLFVQATVWNSKQNDVKQHSFKWTWYIKCIKVWVGWALFQTGGLGQKLPSQPQQAALWIFSNSVMVVERHNPSLCLINLASHWKAQNSVSFMYESGLNPEMQRALLTQIISIHGNNVLFCIEIHRTLKKI